jgi:hypothetical protein
MQQTAGDGGKVQPGDGDDSYRSIVSDLESLIGHVRASMNLIKTAIAGELLPGNDEIAGNVVVLDDITPRYIRANAALDTCNASLGIALQLLQDAAAPPPGGRKTAKRARRAAGSFGRA